MTRRARYYLRSKEEREKWFNHFQTHKLNPVNHPDPAETSIRPQWVVEYDAKPMLEKDYHQPSTGHWHRPEYHQYYGYDFQRHVPDLDRCSVSVHPGERGGTPHQCRNKARYDEDHTGKPTRCKLHARATQKAKAEARQAKWDAEKAERLKNRRIREAKDAALALIEKIADGHNDPRGAALQLLVEHGFRSSDKGD